MSTAGALGGDNIINILDALRNAGRISAAEYDQRAVFFNAGIIDLFTSGKELEFIANPTPNLTFRLGYSNTNRRRGNHYKEIHAYFADNIPQWRQLAAGNQALLNTVNSEIAIIDSELDFQTTRQAAPFGNRPHKANLTGRYSFREGRIKGAFVGGAVRYQSKNFVQTNNATGQDLYGTPTILGDAFAGYRFRLPWRNLPMTAQLNVTNVTNLLSVGVGRYNTTFDGLLRAYLAPPRTYRFTWSVEF